VVGTLIGAQPKADRCTQDFGRGEQPRRPLWFRHVRRPVGQLLEADGDSAPRPQLTPQLQCLLPQADGARGVAPPPGQVAERRERLTARVAGRFELRDDFIVEAATSDQFSWQLGLRGEDGNFYLRLSARVIDSAGAVHTAEAFISVVGEDLVFGEDYLDYRKSCDEAMFAYMKKKMSGMTPLALNFRVPPGVPVMNREVLTMRVTDLAMHSDASVAFEYLKSAFAEFGPQVIANIGALPALPRMLPIGS
jgi:hypothetical protein